MSRVWKLDRAQYGDDGLLTLYRGDDWAVKGTVVDRVNGYETLVDMSQYAVTGFFPPNCYGSCGCPDCQFCGSICSRPTLASPGVTGQSGVVIVSLPAASSPLVRESSAGVPLYLLLKDGQGRIETVPTFDDSVVIVSRALHCS